MDQLVKSIVSGVKPSKIIDVAVYAKETLKIVKSLTTPKEKIAYLEYISSSKPKILQDTKTSIAINILTLLKL